MLSFFKKKKRLAESCIPDTMLEGMVPDAAQDSAISDQVMLDDEPLEQGKRLSESILWQLQRNYFDQAGSLAWQNNIVPSHATSNAYIAQAYARVVMGYLDDALAQGQTGPIHLIDLGAGSGQFAFHFLKKLDYFYRASPLYQKISYRYVIADFTKANLDFCREHPAMQPFIKSGVLDFALIDATEQTSMESAMEIHLLQSGDLLTSDTVPGSMVLIGNYLFDSLPQDLFYLNHQLYECLPKLSIKDTYRDIYQGTYKNKCEKDKGFPEIKAIDMDYDYRSVDANYYEEAHFNKLLDFYSTTITNNATHINFPVVGLRFLDRLIAMASKGLLVLSADKGKASVESLYNQGKPYVAKHGGCFSMSVNYHLIGEYAQHQGGKHWLPEQCPETICVAGFLFGANPQNYGETHYAAQETINRYNPNDFFILKKGIERNFRHMKLPEILSFIRLSGYDSTVFLRASEIIKNRLATATHSDKENIKHLCQQVRENHYDLGRFDLEETIRKIQ